MFCKNCGKNMEGQLGNLCKDCKDLMDALNNAKDVTQGTINENNNKEDFNYNVTNNYYNLKEESKSKIAAALMAFFLGTFGVHNFYLGYNGKAMTQLLLTILSCGLLSFFTGLWSFIEGILILSGGLDKDASGKKLL